MNPIYFTWVKYPSKKRKVILACTVKASEIGFQASASFHDQKFVGLLGVDLIDADGEDFALLAEDFLNSAPPYLGHPACRLFLALDDAFGKGKWDALEPLGSKMY